MTYKIPNYQTEIDTNEASIETNETNIETNRIDIETNQTDIEANGDAITANEANITNLIQFPSTIQTGASFTATWANKVIICNSASTPMTLTLPAIGSGDLGKQIYIKNIHATGTVLITPQAPATIDLAATYLLDGQYEAVMLIVSPTDAPKWFILGSYNGTSP